ncbi:MAG: NAD(P)/FAD-dependent oxidoreductase [Acidimicrobiales bacterium]
MDAIDRPATDHPHDWDVLVVGRSFAGLSAALTLGRARRSVLVVGAGGPRNEAVAHAHGLLGHDHRDPSELVRTAEEQLGRYPTVQLLQGRVTDLATTTDEPGFRATLDGHATTARLVVLATGVNDDPPAIPGLADRWGRGVYTCPFCDGWEHRDQPLAVVGDPAWIPHLAGMLRGGWSERVTAFAELAPEAADALRAQGVAVDPRQIARVEDADGGEHAGLRLVLADGEVVEAAATFVAAVPAANASLATALGAEVDEWGFLVTDEQRSTTVPGLLAVGDVRTRMHQMAVAIADGATAGAMAASALLAAGVPPRRA